VTITITAFQRSPDGGKGLARDTRVRWALEEVGQLYEVRLVSFRAVTQVTAIGPIEYHDPGDDPRQQT
jgi:glutathione S-transferase